MLSLLAALNPETVVVVLVIVAGLLLVAWALNQTNSRGDS